MPLIVQGAILPVLASAEPSLTIWSRLEPLPTSADLGPGLQARIADPLWLLGRQWQFGELQAEDAGTPIDVRVTGEAVPLSRYAPGALDADSPARARDYAATSLPLEVLVEHEPARADNARLAAEAGIQFLRCLVDEGVAQHRTRFLTAPAFALDAITVPDASTNPDGAAWATLCAARTALDGRKLAAAFRPLADDDYVLTSLPPVPVIPAGAAARVRRAAGRWLRWYDQSIAEPAGQPESWNPSRQEYAFAVSADVAEGPIVLAADEYRDGRIDWYSFRAASAPALGVPTAAAAVHVVVPPMLPVPVRYPGMPADRYWEFEDARVNLAELQAGRTDLVQMLLVEFALAFGNDWFVIPVPLAVGSLFRMQACTVRDTFGVESPIPRSRDGDGVPWTMFELSTAPGEPAHLRDLFFLAPTVPLPLAGDPVEQVALFRDEMANLCWGVERKVQGPLGETVDRYLEASRSTVHQRIVDPPADARLIYRLASPVPEHWIPFVPVPARVGGDAAGVRLERRVLLRFDAAGVSRAAHPRGLLLRSDPTLAADAEPPLDIEEEEIPREGAQVERAFQYARGPAGESYLWLGREKRVGAGEGASLLRFDVAEPIGGP